MLAKVSIGRHCCAASTNVENYRSLVGDEIIDEIQTLASQLKGVRICHLNSTANGGGVAELLSRHLPLVQALGVSAEWRLIHGEPEFFTVTKTFHNGLQGGHYDLGDQAHELYLAANEQSAKLLSTEYDVFIVHDPQPVAIRHFSGPRNAKWIWRCHIDSSAPDAIVSSFLTPFIEEYDAFVFTMPEFLLPSLSKHKAHFIAPAIEPMATKNMDLPLDVCKRAIADSGMDLTHPILLQVSRFDPWKDPLGVRFDRRAAT